jgi:uncharacterized protein YcbX
MRVSRIEVFPIKSLDPVRLDASAVTAGGILENDRVYAIFDREGHVVNGKRTSQIHRLRATFDDAIREVSLRPAGEAAAAHFALGDPSLDRWMTEFFGFPVRLKHDSVKGFPDDDVAFGPTIVSTESLERVRGWFGGLPVASVRRRFRSNIEVDGPEPFCEDRLFGAPDHRKPFRVGSVSFLGHNPCQRCVVPTRDPETGEPVHAFQKTFATLREEQLPPWADARRFNHYYRFAVNTSIPPSEAGKRIHVGDAVAL